MTLRTIEDLSDRLDNDLAWRKKELAQYRNLIEGASSSESTRNALIRGGIALLYAHWEGFIKAASEAYLGYVAMQKLRYDQLALNFLAIASRRLLADATTSSKIRFHKAVAQFFRSEMEKQSEVPVRGVIRTKANLSSPILREIVDILGLNYSSFATKEKLIDQSLLRRRNTIAHGSFLEVDENAYIALHTNVLSLLEEFRTQVEEAAGSSQFELPRA